MMKRTRRFASLASCGDPICSSRGSRCELLPLSLMVITSDKQDKCEVIAPAGRSEEVGFRAPGRRIRWSVSTAEVVANSRLQ